MIKVFLVDDEKPALDELKYILDKCDQCEVIGLFTNPVEALNKIRSVQPDLVFLDINMPELSGLQIAEEILKLDLSTQVIFATAYDQHALEAFEKNAVDYILKPFEEGRIKKAIMRVQDSKKQLLNLEWIQKMSSSSGIHQALSRLPLWKGEKIIFINIEDILFVHVLGNEVEIVTKEDKHKVLDTLSHLESKLPEKTFFKTHRAYLVNIKKIKEISPYFNNTLMVKVEGSNEEIPVSRSRTKLFKTILSI